MQGRTVRHPARFSELPDAGACAEAAPINPTHHQFAPSGSCCTCFKVYERRLIHRTKPPIHDKAFSMLGLEQYSLYVQIAGATSVRTEPVAVHFFTPRSLSDLSAYWPACKIPSWHPKFARAWGDCPLQSWPYKYHRWQLPLLQCGRQMLMLLSLRCSACNLDVRSKEASQS